MTLRTPSPQRRRAVARTRIALAFGLVIWVAAGTASAQGTGTSPALSYDATVVARAGTPVSLRVEVQPPQAAPANTYLRIRGLPASASLNEGYRTAPGTWAVPLKSLPNLKVDAPAGTETRADVSLALTTIDGTVLVEGRLQLVFAPPGEAIAAPFALGAGKPADAPAVMGVVQQATPPAPQPARRPAAAAETPPPAPAQVAALPPAAQPTPQAAPQVTAPPAAPAAQGSRLTPQDAERAQRFIERGDSSLKEGDFSAARLFYQRAAMIGSTQAALKLARTYDPAEISKSGAIGFKADVHEARRWYERARELGSEEAAARLATLPAN